MRPNTENEIDLGVFDVDILARTVAAGVVQGIAGSYALKVTLALRPVRPEGGARGAVSLPSWPSAIEDRIGGCRLEVAPIPRLGKGAVLPRPAGLDSVLLDLTPWTTDRPDPAEADALWREVMPEEEGGRFDSLWMGLDPLEPPGEQDDLICMSGKEGDIALVTKIARALETVRVAMAPEPSKELDRIDAIAQAAAAKALEGGESNPLWLLYRQLDGGENESGPLPLGPDDPTLPKDPQNLDITKAKRVMAIEKGLADARAACAGQQAVGADSCGNGKLDEVAKCLTQTDGERTCAPKHCSGQLDEIYDTLFDLRIRFLLAAAMGNAEIEALEESLKTRDDPEPTPYQRPSEAKATGDADVAAMTLARKRLFALDETPDLGRYFRTFIDYALEGPALRQLTEALPKLKDHQLDADNSKRSKRETHFAFVRLAPDGLSVSGPAASEEHARWSLVKFRVERFPDASVARVRQFVPASREEMILTLAEVPAEDQVRHLSQRDGIAILGARDGAGGPTHELIGADLRAAAQDIENRVDRVLSGVSIHDRQPGAWAGARDGAGGGRLIEPAAIRSGGLSLVHFACASRLSRSLGAMKAREGVACCDTYLDAEDLSVGKIADLGLPQTEDGALSGYAWRPLSYKTVLWRGGDLGEDLDLRIAAFYRPGERLRHQATMDRVVPRSLVLPKDGGEVGAQPVAAVDEAEVAFRGPPMGVETGLRDESRGQSRIVASVHPHEDLNIDREIRLPNASSGARQEELAPALRYGMYAKLGARIGYLGGGSLDEEAARAAYLRERDATVPPNGLSKVVGRRFLRSEPVKPVQVFLRKAEAEREVKGYRAVAGRGATLEGEPDIGDDRIRFAPQTTGEITLRSRADLEVEGAVDPLKYHDGLVRFLLPPLLTLDEAERHGVFDGDARPSYFKGPAVETVRTERFRWRLDFNRVSTRQPREGVEELHLAAPWGGPPVLAYRYDETADRRAISGAEADTERAPGAAWLTAAKAWQDNGYKGPMPTAPSGDGIFAKRAVLDGVGLRRETPFYPDPMASRLVLRLRAGPEVLADTAWDLPSAIVDLVQPERWPDVLPVALRIEAGEDADVALALETGSIVKHEGIDCREVVLTLPPGARFSLDIWALPDRGVLTGWSELLDTATTLAANGCLSDYLPDDAPGAARDVCLGGCGLLGHDAPARVDLERMADILLRRMQFRPIPEIAQVQTIELRHAVDRPVDTPRFEAVPDGVGQLQPFLMRRRITGGVHDTAITGDTAAVSTMPESWRLPEGAPPENVEEGGTEADLGGFLALHMPTTGSVEILARAVSPLGEPFDDPDRGRPRQAVLDGTWPKAELAVDGVAEPGKEGTCADGVNRLRCARALVGFAVSPTGRVTLPPRVQLWASLSGLSERPEGEERRLLALHAAFSRRDEAQGGITADVRPLFQDTRARRVEIAVRAVSRHASGFTTRPFIRRGRYYRARSPNSEESDRNLDWSMPIWLPASERPAVPRPAAAAQPAIAERRAEGCGPRRDIVSRRLSVVRLWLERPWFSSGEDERLGIVVWPPMRSARPRRLSVPGMVWRNGTRFERPSTGLVEPSVEGHDFMALDRFEERFLTGAAEYVTRWGSDPIEDHPKHGWQHWMVPPSVFADLSGEVERDSDCTLTRRPLRPDLDYIARAQLPIPDPKSVAEEEPGAAEAEDAPRRQRYLTVDLLAYAPRFDLATERWYVDVTLDPGPMIAPFLQLGVVRYQAHAPRDLRVSLPAAPFETQLLTGRRTTVAVLDEGSGRSRIEVSVRGPASRDAADLTEASLLHDETVASRMIMRLEGRDAATDARRFVAEQRLAPDVVPWPRGMMADAFLAMRREQRWTGGFSVPSRLIADDGIALEVTVEEVAYRPPSSYAEEPRMAPDDRSGASPRYLCQLPVPRPLHEEV